MAVRSREPVERQVGYAQTEAGVWPPVVVVRHPLLQDGSKVAVIQHDQPVETLATTRTYQPLAEGIRLRQRTGVFSTVRPIAPTAPSTPAA
jgi:hypothetical protein